MPAAAGSFHDGPTLEVDLSAIARNYRLVASRFSGSECAGVVKANAYGLGVEQVAPRLATEGCRTFFVATLGEGVALRALLPAQRIFVFHGVGKGEEKDFLAHRLAPVLSSMEQFTRWEKNGGNSEAALHVDTGITRLGLKISEAKQLTEARVRQAGVALLMSHLACGPTPNHPLNAAQRDAFAEVKTLFPGLACSFANSAGVFLGDDFHFDLARPGCALYGIAPFLDGANPMETVAQLTAPIIQTRRIDTACQVGYGATHQAKPGDKIAVVAMGYADGLPRAASGRGQGFIQGIAVPVVGVVSMDMTIFDVSAVPDQHLMEGARIELVGPQQSVDVFAAQAGTIGYEIFTRIGGRVQKLYSE